METLRICDHFTLRSLVSEIPFILRNLAEMMAERGLPISHTTILRLVQQYSPIINRRIRKHLNPTNNSWRVDETYIKKSRGNGLIFIELLIPKVRRLIFGFQKTGIKDQQKNSSRNPKGCS